MEALPQPQPVSQPAWSADLTAPPPPPPPLLPPRSAPPPRPEYPALCSSHAPAATVPPTHRLHRHLLHLRRRHHHPATPPAAPWPRDCAQIAGDNDMLLPPYQIRRARMPHPPDNPPPAGSHDAPECIVKP